MRSEAGVVEDGVHEVACAVAGEGAAGAVGAVGTGGEADDEDTGGGVAEAGDGPGPVGPIEIGAAFGLAQGGAIVAEPGAELAGDDLSREDVEVCLE